MNLQLNFLKRSYVLKNKDNDGMFYIRGHVGFKMGFDKEGTGSSNNSSNGEVHVVAWIQRANYSSIEKIPMNSITVTKTGFDFSIEHSDPRMMDGSIINWIAYTVPRANQDLMATMDAIMNPQRFGKGEAAQAEIKGIVKKFLQKYHVEERDATGRTLLHISATFGNTGLIRYLLKKGADINALDNSGWTALLCAVSSGHFETGIALLEAGAYPNATSESGSNALHYLCRSTEVNEWYIRILQMLLERKCNVNAENNEGNTPVHVAVQRCPSVEVIRMMLSLSKANLTILNKAGYSPLHVAIERNAQNIVEGLIEYDADLTTASPELGTPLAFAQSLKNTAIADLISNKITERANKASIAAAATSAAIAATTAATATAETGAQPPAGEESGMVCLEVVAAQDVRGGTDLYCILDVGEKSFRTEAVSKTNSPVWNKTFRVNTKGVTEVKAMVANLNLTRSTKPLGGVTIPINQQGLRPGATTDEWYDLVSPISKAKVGRIHLIFRVPEAPILPPPAAASASASAGPSLQEPSTLNATIAAMAATTGATATAVMGLEMAAKPNPIIQYSFNMSGKIYDHAFEYEPGFSTMLPIFWEEWTDAATTADAVSYAFKAGTASEGRFVEYSWGCVTHKAAGKCPTFDVGAATYKFLKYVQPYEHFNFFALVDETPIVFIASREHPGSNIRLIVLTPKDDYCLILPVSGNNTGAALKAAQCVTAIRRAIPFVSNQKLHRFKDDETAERLIQDFMRLFTNSRCKFGLVYCAPGQDSEKSFFANETGSPDFDEFCDFIGEKVALLDFQGYAGGLSKTDNLSGTHTVYTRYGNAQAGQEIEVVFHVSTMLPNDPNDEQKIEKKRHIGNDFVVLLFKEANDENDTIDTSTFLSKFNHIFVVVNPVKTDGKTTHYRISIAANDDIRPFPPFMPRTTGNVFEKNAELRDWILMKLNIPLVRGGNMTSRADKLVTIIAKSSKKK